MYANQQQPQWGFDPNAQWQAQQQLAAAQQQNQQQAGQQPGQQGQQNPQQQQVQQPQWGFDPNAQWQQAQQGNIQQQWAMAAGQQWAGAYGGGHQQQWGMGAGMQPQQMQQWGMGGQAANASWQAQPGGWNSFNMSNGWTQGGGVQQQQNNQMNQQQNRASGDGSQNNENQQNQQPNENGGAMNSAEGGEEKEANGSAEQQKGFQQNKGFNQNQMQQQAAGGWNNFNNMGNYNQMNQQRVAGGWNNFNNMGYNNNQFGQGFNQMAQQMMGYNNQGGGFNNYNNQNQFNNYNQNWNNMQKGYNNMGNNMNQNYNNQVGNQMQNNYNQQGNNQGPDGSKETALNFNNQANYAANGGLAAALNKPKPFVKKIEEKKELTLEEWKAEKARKNAEKKAAEALARGETLPSANDKEKSPKDNKGLGLPLPIKPKAKAGGAKQKFSLDDLKKDDVQGAKKKMVVMSKEELDASFTQMTTEEQARIDEENAREKEEYEKYRAELAAQKEKDRLEQERLEREANGGRSPGGASDSNYGGSSPRETPKKTPTTGEPGEVDDWEADADALATPKNRPEDASPTGLSDEDGSPKISPGDEEKVKNLSDLKDPDPRPHANIVFIGHVDAGKSTTCGNILYLSGYVDDRLIEKYQREAREKNRDSWFLAYIMDTSEEEKAKGKTVEVGRAAFATENKRFTILDAPGHKSYVPNMISGASQADVGVLIISARKGEFETGFERGGQTTEHALLAKTLGVDKLIIAVNKMDDADYSEIRYNEIVDKTRHFLNHTCGFKDDQLIYLPIAGLNGANIKTTPIETMPWYKGPTLFKTLDNMEIAIHGRKDGALRIPMLDGYRDMGALMGIGKVEQGTIRPGTKCIIMPTQKTTTATAIYIGEEEVSHATVGESITIKLAGGIAEEDLRKGFVLCPLKEPCRHVMKFKAQFKVLELVEGRPVLTAGYRCVIHFHTAIEDCEISKLLEAVDTKKKRTPNPMFAKIDTTLTCIITLDRKAALDSFGVLEKLGRFTLRDEGITVGIGKILELPKEV